MEISDRTPLLWYSGNHQRSRSEDRLPFHRYDDNQGDALRHKDTAGNDAHAQFCALTGCPPSNLGPKEKFAVPKKSLYGRTVSQLSSQRRAYNFSASLNNTLLLSQVILGAALTGLGASASSHILITIFGAMNTIIAGLVAYLKSRGQPMRARMYKDDLERIVDEIENSEVMWRGISHGVHGYDEIDTDEVTVRSEVARLTRLYDRAIRLNGMNNPDMYMAGAGGFDSNTSGGVRPNRGAAGLPAGVPTTSLPAVAAAAPQPSGENAGPSVPTVENPEDAAPATKADIKDDKKDDKKEEPSTSEGKKPAPGGSDGSSDDHDTTVAQQPDAPSSSSSKPAAEAPVTTPAAPAPSPPPAAADPQPPAPAVPVPAIDPDASPATAARLKPKRHSSSKQGSSDVQKVQGDDDD